MKPKAPGGLLPAHLPHLLLFILAATAATAQGVLPTEVVDRLQPYSQILGGIVLALGLVLAFSGKNVMRLYCGTAGFLFGVRRV